MEGHVECKKCSEMCVGIIYNNNKYCAGCFKYLLKREKGFEEKDDHVCKFVRHYGYQCYRCENYVTSIYVYKYLKACLLCNRGCEEEDLIGCDHVTCKENCPAKEN